MDKTLICTIKFAVAAAPTGRGYYQPTTQSVSTWYRHGERQPKVGWTCLVMAADDGEREMEPGAVYLATLDAEGVWNVNGLTYDALPGDVWTELPLPPRAIL